MTRFHSFLWLSNIPFYTYHNFFIHSSNERHIGCFQIFVHNATMDIALSIYIFFWISGFVFLGQSTRNRNARLYGNSIFNFLRNFHTIFHGGSINLCSHQQCMKVPFSPHPCQHLLFLVFFITVIWQVTLWYLIAVLTCISLMISDFELLFMCLLATYLSSLEKCLFRSSAHFLIGVFGILLLNCMSS